MKNRILTSALAFLILFILAVGVVHGQTKECIDGQGNCPTQISFANPFSKIGDGGLVGLLYAIINNIILPVGGVLAVLSFIWVGFMFVKARGNSTEIGKAKTAFLYTVLGTALLLGADAVSKVIEGTINQLK